MTNKKTPEEMAKQAAAKARADWELKSGHERTFIDGYLAGYEAGRLESNEILLHQGYKQGYEDGKLGRIEEALVGENIARPEDE